MMLAWVVRAILCDKATFDVFGGCESAFIPQIGAIPERERNMTQYSLNFLRLKGKLPFGE